MRLFLAIAAFGLVAAGCGARENEPELASAIEKTQAAGSSLVEVRAMETDNGTLSDVTCEGAADYARGRVRIACAFAGARALEMIGIGDTSYMRGKILGFAGADSKWIKSTDADAASLATLLSPDRLFSTLRDASDEPERLGDEEIRGVATSGYRLNVDCERAEAFGCEGPITPVEVWIDDESLVRRVRIDDTSASGTIEFYDFGVDVAIEAPPADDVRDLDTAPTP